jgi:hypothetical protein
MFIAELNTEGFLGESDLTVSYSFGCIHVVNFQK